MHPRNMTDAEILTEAEAHHAADPLIAALVKMAAGAIGPELAELLADNGIYNADDMRQLLDYAEQMDGVERQAADHAETLETIADGLEDKTAAGKLDAIADDLRAWTE